MAHIPPKEHKVPVIRIPNSLEKPVCFKAFKPEVISKKEDRTNAISLDKKSVFSIQVDIIEKMIM